jgi:hypothetical protein
MRILCALAITGCSAAALASDASLLPGRSEKENLDLGNLSVAYTPATPLTPTPLGGWMPRSVDAAVAAAGVNVGPIPGPKFGIRVGGGPFDGFAFNAGADVTMAVPFLPLPALRLDGEVWESSDFKSRHGDALSLLVEQTLTLGYVGIGPSFYFSDVDGDHHSGFGGKLLAGLNVPGGYFVEAGLLVGPSPSPIFIDLGKRF